MRALKFFEKQPNDVQDYFISFDRWLTVTGGVPSTHTAEAVNVTPGAVSPDDDITLAQSGVTGNSVVVRLSGGKHGNVYKATARLTSDIGLTKESDIMIRVIEV